MASLTLEGKDNRMNQLITGIHHVTALASDAQRNLDFYTGVLGLRMVKKTVNFDAREVYHFYYGDESGNPGSILTFFPYDGLAKGRHGKGFLNTTAFSVPFSALDFWLLRLKRFQVAYKPPQERFFNEVAVYLEDPDGTGLELIFNENDARPGFTYGNIPVEYSIKGFYSVEIWQDGYERTGSVLTEQLNHILVKESGNRFRFAAQDAPGNFIDILCTPDGPKGIAGSGTVHHIAFSTPDKQSQEAVRERLSLGNFHPTEVKDRKYFSSIYFREPGGVLFEVATTGPGFAVDEEKNDLGGKLQLPEWLEKDRNKIETTLTPVALHLEKFK